MTSQRHPSLLSFSVSGCVLLVTQQRHCAGSTEAERLLLIRLSGTDLHVFPWRRKPAHPLFFSVSWRDAEMKLWRLYSDWSCIKPPAETKQNMAFGEYNCNVHTPFSSSLVSTNLCPSVFGSTRVFLSEKNVHLWLKNQNFDLKEAKSCRDKWQRFKKL